MKSFQKISGILVTLILISQTFISCNTSGTDERKSEKMVQQSSGSDKRLIDENLRSFLVDAAIFDMKMISISRTALEVSSNSETKNLAENVISLHEKCLSDLNSMSADLQITIPSVLNESDKMDVEKLKSTKTDQYDAQYYSLVIRDHNKYLPQFEKLASSSIEPVIKTWSGEYAPAYKGIVEEATQSSSALSTASK